MWGHRNAISFPLATVAYNEKSLKQMDNFSYKCLLSKLSQHIQFTFFWSRTESSSSESIRLSCPGWSGSFRRSRLPSMIHLPYQKHQWNCQHSTVHICWPPTSGPSWSSSMHFHWALSHLIPSTSMKDLVSLSPRLKLLLNFHSSNNGLLVTNRTELIFPALVFPDQRQDPDTNHLCPFTSMNGWETTTGLAWCISY